MKRLLRFLSLNLLIWLTLAAAGFLYLRQTQGLHFYSIKNNSMAPILRAGDLAADLKPSALKPGDIVTYYSPPTSNTVATRRVVTVNHTAGYVITKDDNSGQPQTQVPINSVAGQTVKVIPNAGYVLDFLGHPAAMAAVVYAPVAGLAAYELQRLGRHYARRTYRSADYA